MRHFLLFYDYAPNFLELRPALRPAHLEHANAAAGRGELELAGALQGEATGVFLFKSETPAAAEAFALADPYVTNGMVRSWRVREWTTVVGAGALTQLP